MPDELSLVKFSVVNFFSLLLNSRPFSPITTTYIKVVQSLIASEPVPDKSVQERVLWIYNNVHERVHVPLSLIELTVFKNLDKGLNREVEIGNKSFNLAKLYQYLDEVSLELTGIVIAIAKKYSIDIPMQTLTNSKVNYSINLDDK